MFALGFKKIAGIGGMASIGARGGMRNLAKPARIDPVTTRDALGAASTKGAFPRPISNFANRPRKFLKAPSKVRLGG